MSHQCYLDLNGRCMGCGAGGGRKVRRAVMAAVAVGVIAAFTPVAAYATGGTHHPHPPKAQLSGAARCAEGSWIARFVLSNVTSDGTVQVVAVRRDPAASTTATALTPVMVGPNSSISAEVTAPLSVSAVTMQVDYKWTAGVAPGHPAPPGVKTSGHTGGKVRTLTKTVHRCDCPTPPGGGGSTPPGGGESTPPGGGGSTPPSSGGESTPPGGGSSTPPPGGDDEQPPGGGEGGGNPGQGVGASEQLPLTGSGAANAALIGGVLLLGGAAAVVLARRNRRRFES